MRILLSTALLSMPTLVSAAPDTCISIANDLDRLACYDRELGRTPKATMAPASAGKWLLQTEKSKLSDDQSIFLTVRSEETINCGWNNDKIMLVVRCHEKRTSLVFQTGCHMTSSDYNAYGVVDYRLDSDKAQKMSATESTNNRSLGLWDGGKSIPVIKQMFGKSKMVAQMTPYNENPFVATFNIEGLDGAIKPLREECGW